VRIVSLNAWGGTLFDQLARWLPGCGADVVCLQEITRTPGVTGWTTFADRVRTLPQRADLFDDVRELLPHHLALFDASDAGPVVGADGRPCRQEFGLGLFVDRRYPVIDRHARFVHGSFTDHANWPADGRPRVAQAVRIVDGPGRTLTIVHVHGLRVSAGKQDNAERGVQADRLAALVREARKPGDLVVVCGDLNLLPSSGMFDVLGRLGLHDLVGEADTRTSHYSKPVRHASYLLVSDPHAVRRFDILGQPEVSDHRPLVLDL
jgi:endonuclease/exonuclease/phosphatase family metal-dependent hydrolase